MDSYEKLAGLYDPIMGDQKALAGELHRLISKAKPDAESLLELACGTGSLLRYFSRHYEVCGLDSSSSMLAIARSKAPGAGLYLNDMLRFDFGKKYDCIICVNDSVNHLLKKSEWKKLFKNAFKHLRENGILVFDVHTEHKLEMLSKSGPAVHEFGDNMLVTTVSKSGGDIYRWNLRIFENTGDDKFRLTEEDLYERAFPVSEIRYMLLHDFKDVRTVDFERKKVSAGSERVYFTAVKR